MLGRHTEIDWDLVIVRAREWKVATAVWLVIRLARDMAGLTGADAALQRLASARWKKQLLSAWVGDRSDWLWKHHWLGISSAFCMIRLPDSGGK